MQSMVIQIFIETDIDLLIQFLMNANLLDSKLNQSEGRAPQCLRRYIRNATYAVVLALTRKPNKSPLTSEMTKSSNRYPLINITSAATVHAALCNINKKEQKVDQFD